jgi:hypothetical protein
MINADLSRRPGRDIPTESRQNPTTSTLMINAPDQTLRRHPARHLPLKPRRNN